MEIETAKYSSSIILDIYIQYNSTCILLYIIQYCANILVMLRTTLIPPPPTTPPHTSIISTNFMLRNVCLRVFSDGGNFCPEEIEDYRKKLEKMSQKIDSSEGFIMADLEGMESKRLDQASKIAHEFEDRYHPPSR